MHDKFDLRILFKPAKVFHLATSTPENPICYVNFQDYSFPMHAPEVEMINGIPVITYFKNRDWDSISSGISGMAVGFFPTGQGLNNYPSISIKASPAKILQGHNVFGSESCKEGIKQMLVNLSVAFPDIYADLDIENAEIRYIDCTYSARIRDFFSVKVFALFESLASKRTKVNKDKDYIQLGYGSEYQRQKLYKKLQELFADLANARKTRNQFRIAILSDQRLLDFATDLHRFEATTGYRKLLNLGIPTKLNEFIKFEEWFLSVHNMTLCQHLWEQAFNPLFAQFEGHTMCKVDDSTIKLKIYAKYTRIKDNGKICRRLSKAVYDTYQDIKREGYLSLVAEDNATFFRNVNYLEQLGLSRAFLKSLSPNDMDTNVIPFVQIIKIDFNNQRPDWYIEPKAQYSDEFPERLIRLVG